MPIKMLDGNAAAVEAIRLARVKVVCAYPITPQSPIAEGLALRVEEEALDADYIRVESEHSALSVATSAQLTGVRAATATASNGLALMHEILSITAGIRVPLVMPVVNRGVAAPWTLWCEHTDAMLQRDTGWLQFYCQNAQEVLDLTLCAYRAAEHRDVLLPAMVCMDGFFVSHSMQKVDAPAPEEADAFLGPYTPQNLCLDPARPVAICDLTPSEDYTEMRFQQAHAMGRAVEVAGEVLSDFSARFGRTLRPVEAYRTEDADAVLVGLGSLCGTARYVVDRMREAGKKVGLLKISLYRPFPAQAVREALAGRPAVGVFDRSSCMGTLGGPLWSDVVAAVQGQAGPILDFVGGLGGRDVPQQTLVRLYDQLLATAAGAQGEHTPWIDLKGDPFQIREVSADG